MNSVCPPTRWKPADAAPPWVWPGAAYVHGRAGHLGWRHGLVAGDLLDLLPAVLDRRSSED